VILAYLAYLAPYLLWLGVGLVVGCFVGVLVGAALNAASRRPPS